jgi:lipopolysaccharide assembly protein A
MKQLAWLFKWLLKAAIFFTLFAFALNNQGDVTVHFFFGTHWTGPMVLVVLSTFAVGVGVGVLGMVPRWWNHRRNARKAQQEVARARAATDIEQLPPHGL